MKEQDPKYQRKRKFIKTPTLPGGKKAFMEFIHQNLRYPEEALKNRIEGIVYIHYYVDDNGQVAEINIRRGLGYGCDEEAARLIRMLQFEPVKNRGLRLKALMKARIAFKLPPNEETAEQSQPIEGVNLNYTIVSASKPSSDQQPEKSSQGYTITLG